MKNATRYVLKVVFTTMVLILPVTLIIMLLYMNLFMSNNDSWNFDTHLHYPDLVILVITLFLSFLIAARSLPRSNGTGYQKSTLICIAVFLSALLFFIYLVLSGTLEKKTFDELFVSYLPSYLIAIVCMSIYQLNPETDHCFKFPPKKDIG